MLYPRRLLAAIFFWMICLINSPAYSQNEFKTVEDSAPQEVVEAMSLKFARGVSNVALGWLELPKQIYQTFRNDGVFMGLTIGPIKGIGMTLVRTFSGVGEVVTFPSPYPGFYEPYFAPGFVWEEEPSAKNKKLETEYKKPVAYPLTGESAVK